MIQSRIVGELKFMYIEKNVFCFFFNNNAWKKKRYSPFADDLDYEKVKLYGFNVFIDANEEDELNGHYDCANKDQIPCELYQLDNQNQEAIGYSNVLMLYTYK